MKKPNGGDLWLPKLHPQQRKLFETLANEPLYGGATRGGKSHADRICTIVWCSHVPGLQCDIFRLCFDDVIANHMEGRYSFPELLAPWERDGLVTINKTEVKFLWNGSQISLEHCSDDTVKTKHQGIPRQVRIFEEGTQIPSGIYRWLRAWMTVTEEMKDQLPECLGELYPQYTAAQLRNFFPKIISTTNPIGVSATYYRSGFVKAAPRETIFMAPENDGGFSRIYIPARVEDNPSEDAEAVKRRVNGLGDDQIADALLNENWDAIVGDFLPQYDSRLHDIADFTPPPHWFKFITFDWGSSDPFAVVWWAISDGEEFIDDNKQSRWYPRESLIAYREWYGCNDKDTSKGLELRNEEIAAGIFDRTTEPWSGITLADSLPFQDRGFSKNGKKYNIADVFKECGLPLIRANTARIHGWAQLRDRLIGKDGMPLIYFQENCCYLRDYLPALPRHKLKKEDAAESGESTHMADCARYAAATRPPVVDEKPAPRVRLANETPTPMELIKQINNRSRYDVRARFR